jgi:hypothetical protein
MKRTIAHPNKMGLFGNWPIPSPTSGIKKRATRPEIQMTGAKQRKNQSNLLKRFAAKR